MSTIPFWSDPVFWVVLAILTSYSVRGFLSTLKNKRATPGQMKRSGQTGLAWTAHFGFWSVTLIVHPVLAWATAKLWPLWQIHGAAIALCLILAGVIGYVLQTGWSRAAGSSDAWSQDGRPNDAGIIHIQHMSVEIGIMLMLLVSGLWYREMTLSMFLGVAFIIANHFYLGTHWPLKAWFHQWRPADMTQTLGWSARVLSICVMSFLYGIGFRLLTLN